jgi:hypothetical protein
VGEAIGARFPCQLVAAMAPPQSVSIGAVRHGAGLVSAAALAGTAAVAAQSDIATHAIVGPFLVSHLHASLCFL